MEIKLADNSNFTLESMDTFDRYQVVRRVFRFHGGELMLVENPFTETWSPARRWEKAAEILSGDYITYCAFEGNRVIGEIMLIPALNDGRLIVDSFHVSREHRREGVGRALFHTAAAEARKRGAHALYISACSAEETIRFYFDMGCRPSEQPIPACVEAEPWDLQLECPV